MMGSICFGLVLVCSSSVHTETLSGDSKGKVTDIGPEVGLSGRESSQPFLFHANEEILANSGRAGIYKSLNGGQSWIRAQSGLITTAGVEPYVLHLCQSMSAPEIVYAVTSGDGVARTNSFGDTWEPLIPTENRLLYRCAVDPMDPDVVYVLAQINRPALVKSTDGGRSFFVVGAGLPPMIQYGLDIAIASTGALSIYVSTDSFPEGPHLYVSDDGAATFHSLPLPGRDWAVKVYPHPSDDERLVVLTSAALFLSSDRGASFTRVGDGLPSYSDGTDMLAFDPVDASVIYAAAGPRGLFRSIDGALTFERMSGLGDHRLLGLGATGVALQQADPSNAAILYASTALGPVRSNDSGQSFVSIHNGYRGALVTGLALDAAGRLLVTITNSVGPFRLDASGSYEFIGNTLPADVTSYVFAAAAALDDPDIYWLGGGFLECGVYRTDDGGKSWSRAFISDRPVIGGSAMRIAAAPGNRSRVYMSLASGTAPGLYRSSDGGLSFEYLRINNLYPLAVDPKDADIVYVGTLYSGGLYKSIDGGRTLQQLLSGAFSAIVISEQPQTIYAASAIDRMILRSTDGGQTFEPAAQGLQGERVLALALDPSKSRRLFAWAYAGGLFRSDDGATTWMAVDTDETLRRTTSGTTRGSLIVDPGNPLRVYLGGTSVLQFVDQ